MVLNRAGLPASGANGFIGEAPDHRRIGAEGKLVEAINSAALKTDTVKVQKQGIEAFIS